MAMRTMRSTASAGTGRGDPPAAISSAPLWQAVAQTPQPMQRVRSNAGTSAFRGVPSRRSGTIWIAATGQARAQREQPLQAPGAWRGAKPLGFTEASPHRLAPCSCSQQQPQQLQTNVGRRRTLSAICTSPASRDRASSSSASPRSTARPKPRRTTNSAPPSSDRQASMGAPQAVPRCSALWRQKQRDTAQARASPTTALARCQSRTSGSGSSARAGSWTSARPMVVAPPKASRAKASSPWV